MKKPFKILAAIVIAVALIGLIGYGFKNKIQDMLANINYVAKVGKTKITEDQYKYFLSNTKNSIEQSSGVQTDADKKKLWAGKLGTENATDYAKEQALESTTDFVILLDKAKAAKYTLSQDEIKKSDDSIDSYLKTLGTGNTATKTFETQYGLSPDKVKAVSRDLTLVQKYYTDELKKITPTDDELKKYYDGNTDTYKQVTVNHVLFLTVDPNTNQPLSQDKQDEAKKKAEDILSKVKAGADIAALAKQYSEDSGSKDNGGEYTFAKGKMVKEFEDWSFSAKVGDVGLVKTQYGYHVIKLQKIVGFDDVKDTVKSGYINKKFDDKLTQWKKSSDYTLKKNDSALSKIKI